MTEADDSRPVVRVPSRGRRCFRSVSWRMIRNWVLRNPSSRFQITDMRTGKHKQFTREEAYLLCSLGMLGAFADAAAFASDRLDNGRKT